MLTFPMLKIISPANPKQENKKSFCITLRQWAILFSILFFIVMAIITTCMVLGTLHTKQLLHLLEDDIEQERDKHRWEDEKIRITSNEARLQHSQEIVLTFSKILSICMWMSWLNLVLTALLIYGVTTMTIVYIIPWILLSGATYLLAITTIIMAYLQLIPGLFVCYTVLLVALGASLIFIEMWYTIVLYYLSLARARCSSCASCSPNVIHAYGGYTHTIQPNNYPNKHVV